MIKMVKQQPMNRIYASIALGLGWLLFLALWLFYYAATYGILQNIAVFIVSIGVGLRRPFAAGRSRMSSSN